MDLIGANSSKKIAAKDIALSLDVLIVRPHLYNASIMT
jgi:hypothetical protein